MDNSIQRRAGIESANQQLERKSVAGFQERLMEVEQQSSTLLHDRNGSILARFDPRERARVAGEVAMLKDELEQRKRILHLYHETQIAVTKEFCDNLIIKVQVGNQADLAKYITRSLTEVIQDANNMRDEMTLEMEQQYEKIQKISLNSLREIRMQDLEKDMVRYFDFIQKLLDRFEKATESQLSSS